jgi:hypothetical protein
MTLRLTVLQWYPSDYAGCTTQNLLALQNTLKSMENEVGLLSATSCKYHDPIVSKLISFVPINNPRLITLNSVFVKVLPRPTQSLAWSI